MPLFCRIDVIAWGICTLGHSITAYGLDNPPTLKTLMISKRYSRFVDGRVISPALVDSVASIDVMNVSMKSVGGMYSSLLFSCMSSYVSFRLSMKIVGSSPLSLSRSNSHEKYAFWSEASVDLLHACPVGMSIGLICPSCVSKLLLPSSTCLILALC